MFSFTELRGQSSVLDKHGAIEINTEYYTRRKPAWLVLVKLLGVAAMVAVGFAIALPTAQQYLALWQAVAAIAGAMLVYTGIAFFFRPEANTDNMGWFGGMSNDPTQYSDNINRLLWKLHMTLGPGRFTATALLDFCVLLGMASSEEVIDDQAEAAAGNDQPTVATKPALVPNRFEVPPPGPLGGQQQLDSWKYFQQG